MIPQIIVALIVIIVIYIIYRSFIKVTYVKLGSLQHGNQTSTVSPNTLPSNNSSNNYTYSLWFYIQDWNYKYGEKKVILDRSNNGKNKTRDHQKSFNVGHS